MKKNNEINHKIFSVMKTFKRDEISTINAFIFLSILAITDTILLLLFTKGYFWNQLFFVDSIDTGMDFLHSIEYTVGRSPYELFGTLYPPLANLFFYILLQFVPKWEVDMWADDFGASVGARTTSSDLRVYQPTLMLLLIFILITSMWLVFMCVKYIGFEEHGFAIGLCMLFSLGYMWALERGNIIILSVLLTLFFVLYKDSKNKFLAELALIALAISAGIKVYPALFGIILLYDRQIKKAIRLLLYGVFFYFVPYLVFINGTDAVGNNITSIVNTGNTYGFTCSGTAFSSLINLIISIFGELFNVNVESIFTNEFLPKCNLLIMGMLLIMGFFYKKSWQKYLTVTMAMLLYKSQALYTLSFIVIPLLLFLKEEKTLTKRNIIPFLGIVIMNLLLPLDSNNIKFIVSAQNFKVEICLLVIFFYLIILLVMNARKYIKYLCLKKKE